MGRIRVLDGNTVDKIAAGEVVERPASVLKELVENSLDAGASSLSISVEEGGRDLVLVRDDGCGMPLDDARLSFERHATSKISSLEDLQSIASYGFRGEALSSIASVSKVSLRTKEHGSTEGTAVLLEGGAVKSVEPVGCPDGTEVAVRDLFFNVPPRRKSMRSRPAELARCREVVTDYILCRPGLSFTFSCDGRTDLVHVPQEGMDGSLTLAFGRAVADGMMFGEADTDGMRAEAHLGRLEHSKGSASDLRLFVNDRPVRSQALVSAVVRAYGSRLMKDRFPVGVLKLRVDGSMVDVNVHPTKREVQFGDPGLVLDLVSRCVSGALESSDLFFRYEQTRFGQAFGAEGGARPSTSSGASQTQLVGDTVETAAKESPSVNPLAQIMSTYILAESGESLVLIDQHAASERIVYERMLRAVEQGADISQDLLTPLVLTLTGPEARAVEENRELLEGVGFEVEPFGENDYALRAIPTVLGVAQGELALRNILSELSESGSPRRLGLEVIWRVSCHTAIRAGQSLSHTEMRRLVSDLMATESPYTCEHGRPTMIVLSAADLEKLFKRRV
jgi:DNA mismatch repair protein MutL